MSQLKVDPVFLAQLRLDDHGAGYKTLYSENERWKRVPKDGSQPEWFFAPPFNDYRKKVSPKLAGYLEDLSINPDVVRIVRRPRLLKATKTYIEKLEDIPRTSDLEGQTIEWLVDGIIPGRSLILLCAPPGSYKTWLGLSMASAISQGEDFLERKTERVPVLYINKDDPLHVIAQRRETLGLKEGPYFKIWGRWIGDEPPDIGDKRLEEIARAHQPLIVFDPFLHFHPADENSSKQMAEVMMKLLRIVQAGATVLLIHHGPKNELAAKYRGSTEILAAVDVAFSLSVKATKGEPTITLECFKHRMTQEFQLTIRPDFEHHQFEVLADTEAQETNDLIAKLRSIIQQKPGQQQQEVIASSGIAEHKVTAILNAHEGVHWKITRPHGKTKLYFPMQAKSA